MIHRLAFLAVLLALVALAPRASAVAADATLFAAASTTDALQTIARDYESEGHGHIVLVFAASSTLARQIENGAPADLFLSADEIWMDYLAKRNLIVPASRVDYLSNSLVLIAPSDSSLTLAIAPGFPLAEGLGDSRLAMGDPAHVPAGIYGKAALETLGVWPAVAAKVVPSPDVRAALAFVERGEAAAGIVYATDAAHAKVRIVGTFPAGSHPPIRYPLALVAGHDRPPASDFYGYLRGAHARSVFEKHGFTVE